MSIFKEIAGSPKLSFFIWSVLLAGLVLNLTSLVSVSWLDVYVRTESFNMTVSVGLWRMCMATSGESLGFSNCVGIPYVAGKLFIP